MAAQVGLAASIHNSGVRAHDLALTVPAMGVVWQQTFLAAAIGQTTDAHRRERRVFGQPSSPTRSRL